jgi:hypothetical protein
MIPVNRRKITVTKWNAGFLIKLFSVLINFFKENESMLIFISLKKVVDGCVSK